MCVSKICAWLLKLTCGRYGLIGLRLGLRGAGKRVVRTSEHVGCVGGRVVG